MAEQGLEGQKLYNELSPAQAERLYLLMEEMGEAIQAIGKVLRHGYEGYNPLLPIKGRNTNRGDLEKEMGHVLCALALMKSAGDIDFGVIQDAQNIKNLKIASYLHHQKGDYPGSGVKPRSSGRRYKPCR